MQESTQEQTQETTKKGSNQEENNDAKYVKRQKQTCILKLVTDRPEMPRKLELDDNKRKQLEELMLEYPTKEEQNEQGNNPEEQIAEKRLSTCLHCGKIQYDKRKTEPPRSK